MAKAARILVIEDNPDNLAVAVYVLEYFGFEVLTAHDGETGITIATTQLPDLIICDGKLPGISGLEVATRLKANAITRLIPLVALTGMAAEVDRKDALASGFDDFVAKPISAQQFIDTVRKFVPFPEQS